ncbi:hypothetical protein JIG36_25385 [Actinoplanes sp. LDG1-06]|uniref:Uncharacterized protein n=1 Tax=Paractinoplanes ovalisporus TaxID=2810368 RepID=A0ABS2AGE5_9ACTN|nr:hypothetical protein [Actinoplanes ovalisporus]MBM2618897.1 hypothetical protein [Actinoplanes ovalisporus]
MGADAEVHLFDHERYRAEVVPVLVEVLRGGAVAGWVEEIFRRAAHFEEWGYDVLWPRMVASLRQRPVDLAAHAGWLGDDLRYLGDEAEPLLPRRLVGCVDGESCFFALHNGHREAFNSLHEGLMTTRCLGSSQFVGRTVSPDFYLPVLERLGVESTDPVRGLLKALGVRGAVVGYQWEISSGTLGWLTVAETRELAERLDKLDLPRFEPSFAAMAEQDRRRDWPATSLAFVRSVATIAASRDRGVLWGNDVDSTFWSNEGLGFHYEV